MIAVANTPAAADATRRLQEGGIQRLVRKVGLWRLVASALILVLAILAARWSWHLPMSRDWERSLYDRRVYLTAPRVDQDPRIVEVVYNDDTLAALGKRSPLDRALLAKALTNLDRLGAKAIGIDILIDQQQPEDGQLVAAFRGMRTPTWLAYTSAVDNPDQVIGWQQDFMDRFQAQLAPGNVGKASIRIEADGDNVARNWPPVSRAPSPRLLATAMMGIDRRAPGYRGSLRFRVPAAADRPEFLRLPIDLFANPATADVLRAQIAGRYVLIGGDISDTDLWDTAVTRVSHRQVIGLDLHAVMLAQLLDRDRLAVPPGWSLWLAALIVVTLGAATATLDLKTWQVVAIVAGEFVAVFVIPFALQAAHVDTQTLPATGWFVGWALAYAAIGTAARGVGADQRRFAQSAIGRYLPTEVAREIMRDPDRISLTGEKREIVALFTDLEGFTKLSHAISPEMVAYLLNRYLDMMCAIVLAHGGTIDKFVGDAVVAFWGAPIARPDDDARALAAGIAMYEAGEWFRTQAPDGVPPIGRTRVGMHRGEAVVGNFGGEGRIQYTALGDAMNAAARLEGANKYLGTTVLVSGTVAARVDDDVLIPMGRIAVSGRSAGLDVFEPARRLSRDERRTVAALHARFDAGDAAAIDELAAFVATLSPDPALAGLVERARKTGPGETYVLDAK